MKASILVAAAMAATVSRTTCFALSSFFFGGFGAIAVSASTGTPGKITLPGLGNALDVELAGSAGDTLDSQPGKDDLGLSHSSGNLTGTVSSASAHTLGDEDNICRGNKAPNGQCESSDPAPRGESRLAAERERASSCDPGDLS